MAVNGVHDTGEELAQKWLYRQDTLGTRDTTLEVLLYDDGTDNLSDSSDVGAITSEPTDGNYTRQTLNLDSTDLSLSQDASGNLLVEGQVTFDLTNTTGSADAYAVVVSFQSTVVNSETGQNPHLLFSATFNEGQVNLDAQGSGFTVNLDQTLN